ncbi:MAG: hypothetical protein ACLPXB_04010 [Thiobacillaceae bacterium]
MRAEGMMEALYADLDQSELKSVAQCCSLSIDDVRQEARLLCWSIASGQCDFDPVRGTPRRYVMGRLWGMTQRYQVSLRLDSLGHDDASPSLDTPWVRDRLLASPHAQEPVDPLNALLEREETTEQVRLKSSRKQEVLAQLTTRDRTLAELLLSVPIEQVADLYGLSVRAVRYRHEGLFRQLGEIGFQSGPVMNCLSKCF